MFQQKHRREIWWGAAGQEQADGGDVMGLADMDVPSARATIFTTGAGWLERLGENSGRKKAGCMGGRKNEKESL